MPLLGENAVWAWVNFNGLGTVAIRDSFRVSSITDNGTGNYQVNLSSSAGNAACVVTGGYQFTTSTQGSRPVISQRRGTYSANSHRIRGFNAPGSVTADFAHISSSTIKS